MTTELIVFDIVSVTLFLLAFVCLLNPLKVNIVANRWFGLFLFSVGCMVLNAIIYDAKAENYYPRLIAINELSRFAMAPALYLSILHFTSPDKVFKKQEYWHFIPFLLFFIFIVPAASVPGGHSPGLVQLPDFIEGVLPVLVFLSVKIQVVVYWVLSWYKLAKHQKYIRLVTSDTKPVDLSWLKFLLLGIAFMILLWLNKLFFGIPFLVTYAPIGCLAAVLSICYFLLAQKEIYPFEKNDLEDISRIITGQKDTRTARPKLADERLQILKSRLVQLMEVERLYLDNELSLPQLANQMDISSHDLSWLLNDGFAKNFYQFINAYRVEEAKQLLISPKHQHLNILGIAYSAGFNSKTTFNTTFKKETGMSPSQFIDNFKAAGLQTSS